MLLLGSVSTGGQVFYPCVSVSLFKVYTQYWYLRGQAIRDDIKILGHVVYVRMSVSLSVRGWDIDIKNFTVSLIRNTACTVFSVLTFDPLLFTLQVSVL